MALLPLPSGPYPLEQNGHINAPHTLQFSKQLYLWLEIWTCWAWKPLSATVYWTSWLANLWQSRWETTYWPPQWAVVPLGPIPLLFTLTQQSTVQTTSSNLHMNMAILCIIIKKYKSAYREGQTVSECWQNKRDRCWILMSIDRSSVDIFPWTSV